MSLLEYIQHTGPVVRGVLWILVILSIFTWAIIFFKIFEFAFAYRKFKRENEKEDVDALARGLTFLATVGSASPFIGLFGTVWGIMDSFRKIAQYTSVSLSVVAPGIAEALISTALGLFCAIPAVIAYNYFSATLEKIERRREKVEKEVQ